MPLAQTRRGRIDAHRHRGNRRNGGRRASCAPLGRRALFILTGGFYRRILAACYPSVITDQGFCLIDGHIHGHRRADAEFSARRPSSTGAARTTRRTRAGSPSRRPAAGGSHLYVGGGNNLALARL